MTRAQVTELRTTRRRKSQAAGTLPAQPRPVTQAAIYARVSTRDKGQDPENQLRVMREYCSRQNWTYQEYEDRDTGTNADRAGFQSMLRDAGDRFQILVFWSLDRLSREGAKATLDHIDYLNRRGVDWVSITEEYLRSTTLGPFKDAVIAILGTIASQESQRLRDRVRIGLARARAEGRRLGRPIVDVDQESLVRMWAQQWSLSQMSKATGKPKSTIRRRIKELMAAGVIQEQEQKEIA